MDPEQPPSNNTTNPAPQTENHVRREPTPSTRTRSNAMRMSLTPSLAPSELGDRVEVAGDVVEATYQPSRSQFTFGKDDYFHLFVMKLTHTKFFNRLMLIIILINAIVICIQLETDTKKRDLHKAFVILNDIFLAAYTLEFLLKLYSDRTSYWFSVYNLFDFAILVVAFADLALEYISARYDDKVMDLIRSMRSFRALKIVNFLPGVQVIATALVHTLKELIQDVVLLLFLILFVFGIMGFYFFGYDAKSETVLESWGSLGDAFLSLFTIVTADSWWKFILELIEEGAYNPFLSRAYIMIFLFIGHFIASNLFIAVIITNIQCSSNKFKQQMLKEREILVENRKIDFWKRSRREVKKMIRGSDADGESNFDRLATDFYFAIPKRDFIVKGDLKSSRLWMDVFLKELVRNQKFLRRTVNLHFETVETIGPLINYVEQDTRKPSISQHSRYTMNIKHRMSPLQMLQTPSSNLNLPPGRRASFRRPSMFGT